MNYLRGVFTLTFLMLPIVAHAESFNLKNASQKISVDARLDDSAWQQAEVLSLNYETNPGNNTQPAVATEVMLLTFDNTIYIAFKAYDPQPEKIRAFLRDRDSSPDDDTVTITIDTFGSAQIAHRFSVNALGVQTDRVRNESADEESSSWDASWDSAGRITDFGYIVEMAIPLNALRFPDSGAQEWKINLERSYPREQYYQYSLNPSDRNNSCVTCQYSMMRGLEGAKPSANTEFTPSLVYGHSQSRDFDEPWPDADSEADAGLDIRWGITTNISLNATLNPDYSQVEADTAQIDINQQFDEDLEEKRSFFLEGADHFESNQQLVYTRSIIDPNYGLKITGKENHHSIGVMMIEDNQTHIILPGSENSSTIDLSNRNNPVSSLSTIARYQYQVANGLSLGLLLTNREAKEVDYKNTLLSADGFWQVNDSDRLHIQTMKSQTNYPELIQTLYQQQEYLDDMAHFFSYEHETDSWIYSIEYQEFGQDFRADSGFIPQVGFNEQTAKAGHIWHSDKQWWTELELELEWIIARDEGGNTLEKGFQTALDIEAIGQSRIEIKADNHNKYFNTVSYPGQSYELAIETKPYAGINFFIELEYGDTIDTDNERSGVEQKEIIGANLNIGRHLLVELNLENEQFSVSGGRLFTAQAQDLRISYQFTNNSRLRLSLIREEIHKNTQLYLDPGDENSIDKEQYMQLIYSYKLNPQSVFFVGYGKNTYSDDETQQWFTDEKSFFVKLRYQWIN